MKKENIFTYAAVLIILIGAIGIYANYFDINLVGNFFNSRIINQKIVREDSYSPTPSPQPTPPPPTPVPEPRKSTESTDKKTDNLELNPEAQYYLQAGTYTNPGKEISNVKIRSISPGEPKPGRTPIAPDIDQSEFNIIRGIFNYMNEFPTYKKDDDNSWDLTVNDIFDKGINQNYCNQYGLLFVTLARLYNIPTKFIQTYRTDWSNKQKQQGCWDGTTSGHVYAQVYVDGEWYTIDSTHRSFVAVDNNGNVLDDNSNVIAIKFAEGRDHGDIMPHINRWCLEGLRYHQAISPLPLCGDYKQNFNEDQFTWLLACSKPLDTITFQKKGEN